MSGLLPIVSGWLELDFGVVPWSSQPGRVRSVAQSLLLELLLEPVPEVLLLGPLSGYVPEEVPASARRVVPLELVSVPELLELLVEPVLPVSSRECMLEHALDAAKPKAAARTTQSRVFMSVPR